MDLHVSTTLIGDAVVIAVGGVADLASTPTLHDHLRRATTDHPGARLVVDLDGVVGLDDAILGLLLGAAARSRASGGDLRVVCTGDRIRDHLAATRFDLAVAVGSSVV